VSIIQGFAAGYVMVMLAFIFAELYYIRKLLGG
jgi:hypothetical protein